MNQIRKHWAPLVAVITPVVFMVVVSLAAWYLSQQDRAVKINDHGVPVQAAAPYRGPVPNPMTNPTGAPAPSIPPLPPGATFRSLDKINAAAARVGCDTLKPDDPAGKLIDVAECLGARAVAPGQKK